LTLLLYGILFIQVLVWILILTFLLIRRLISHKKDDPVTECKFSKKEIYPKWVLNRTVFNSIFPHFTEEEYTNLEYLYKHESN